MKLSRFRRVWALSLFAVTSLSLGAVGAVVGCGPFNDIWVPDNGSNAVSVVRASKGAVLATLTGNGLSPARRATVVGRNGGSP